MQPETSESLSRPRYPWGLKLVTGLMGEGKSAYVVQHIICAELIKTDRAVYTNMHTCQFAVKMHQQFADESAPFWGCRTSSQWNNKTQ